MSRAATEGYLLDTSVLSAFAPDRAAVLRRMDEGGAPPGLVLAAVPADAPLRLAERLDALPGMHAEFRQFAGLGHGPMLAASLRPALRLLAGLELWEATP